MKKLFISQPMKDKTQEQIMKERADAVEMAKAILDDDVEVMDTYFTDFDESTMKNVPLRYLARSIEMLADADAAFFAPGWSDARGCKIEHQCAMAYGIDVVCDDMYPNTVEE